MTYIQEQTEKLAQIYKETLALRLIANINAIFNGILLFYMLLIGFTGMPIVVVFCLFVMNAVFYWSHWFTTKARK
jgi:hypothetical protein